MQVITYSVALLVKRHRGTMLVILTCPHDGSETPRRVSERTSGATPNNCQFRTGRDSDTAGITEAVAQKILEVTGISPYVVIARFHRMFIDANRSAECAYTDRDARSYYKVKWLTGSESIRIKVVACCAEVTPATYRSGIRTGTLVIPGGRIVTGAVPITPNLLPHLNTPYVLTRPVGQEILTTHGRMIRVVDYFGANLQDNIVSAIRVPDLVWGVSGGNSDRANTMFDVQLIDVTDPNNPRVLDTLTLPQGFPPNTPLVTRSNYPGRPREIRVIKNPTFQTGTQQLLDDEAAPDFTIYDGTFTEPGNRQILDPGALLILVDPANCINEGNNENDNELRF